MTEPLQSFDWKDSNYERPTNSWVCGRACDGAGCRLGPNRKGECQVESRCQPEKKGDRYHCTRPPVHGGKCKEGPTPDGNCCQIDTSCQPQRSLFAKRRLLGMITAVAAFAVCLIIFSGTTPSPLLCPGQVTTSHANIQKQCAACHSAAEGGLTTWVQTAFNSETALKDSALCMKCHTEIGKQALFAHSMSPKQLAETTERINQQNQSTSTPLALRLATFTGKSTTDKKLACASCHKEHQGRKADLKHLTDMQCQSCHTKQFHSFEHGHPDLKNYPHKRRSRIYFDHAKHLNQYFVDDEFKRTMPNGRKLDSCNSCHSPDASGEMMLTKSFDKTCASCHEPQIEDTEFAGVPFFALPAINAELINSHGEWLHTRGTMKTAKLPQFMEQLLASDPDYQKAIKTLGKIDYRQINNLDPKHHVAVGEIAWSIKQLLYDISTQGETALKERLGDQSSEYLHLKPSIIPTLKQAQQLWFPHLHKEMKQHQQKKTITFTPTNKDKTTTPSSPETSSGWYISKDDFTIRYRPIGHADPLLKQWLEKAIQNESHLTENNNMWRILSSPSASGTEMTSGALSSGRCLMCHSVDKNPMTGLSKINWKPKQASSTDHNFTQFSHAPHLQMGSSQQCDSCHVFNQAENHDKTIYREDYFQRDAENLFWQMNLNGQQPCTSGFQPINKKKCATCHNKATTTQSCLQCHKYHAHIVRIRE